MFLGNIVFHLYTDSLLSTECSPGLGEIKIEIYFISTMYVVLALGHVYLFINYFFFIILML